MRRAPKKGRPRIDGPRQNRSRPRNLGSSSKCRGGHGTAAKPNSVKAGSDPSLSACEGASQCDRRAALGMAAMARTPVFRDNSCRSAVRPKGKFPSRQSSKGPVALGPSSSCRDDLGDRGVQSLGGGERSIVLKFTGAAIDFDRIEARPCCRSLLAKSVEQFVCRSLIARKNHAVPRPQSRRCTLVLCGSSVN